MTPLLAIGDTKRPRERVTHLEGECIEGGRHQVAVGTGGTKPWTGTLVPEHTR